MSPAIPEDSLLKAKKLEFELMQDLFRKMRALCWEKCIASVKMVCWPMLVWSDWICAFHSLAAVCYLNKRRTCDTSIPPVWHACLYCVFFAAWPASGWDVLHWSMRLKVSSGPRACRGTASRDAAAAGCSSAIFDVAFFQPHYRIIFTAKYHDITFLIST